MPDDHFWREAQADSSALNLRGAYLGRPAGGPFARSVALVAICGCDPTRGSRPTFVIARASEAGTASCCANTGGSGRVWRSVVSLGGEGTQVGVCGVERDAELLWVASGLCEDEPALDGGEGRCRETGGVRAAPELAVGLHLS